MKNLCCNMVHAADLHPASAHHPQWRASQCMDLQTGKKNKTINRIFLLSDKNKKTEAKSSFNQHITISLHFSNILLMCVDQSWEVSVIFFFFPIKLYFRPITVFHALDLQETGFTQFAYVSLFFFHTRLHPNSKATLILPGNDKT